MNKEQLLNEIEKKADEIKYLKKALMNKDEETILVSDCIKIENNCGGGDGLGIVFSNNKQTLVYDGSNEVFQVRSSYMGDFVQCKLVPCNYEDIKEGDTFYASQYLRKLSSEFENINYYYKKLKEKDRAVCVNESNDTSNEDNMHCYNYFWKVEEVMNE